MEAETYLQLILGVFIFIVLILLFVLYSQKRENGNNNNSNRKSIFGPGGQQWVYTNPVVVSYY
jgi:hypothetical protein